MGSRPAGRASPRSTRPGTVVPVRSSRLGCLLRPLYAWHTEETGGSVGDAVDRPLTVQPFIGDYASMRLKNAQEESPEWRNMRCTLP